MKITPKLFVLGNVLDVTIYTIAFALASLLPILPTMTILQALLLGVVARLATLSLFFGPLAISWVVLKVAERLTRPAGTDESNCDDYDDYDEEGAWTY